MKKMRILRIRIFPTDYTDWKDSEKELI